MGFHNVGNVGALLVKALFPAMQFFQFFVLLGSLIAVIINVKIAVVTKTLYLTDKGEHTVLYKFNKNVYTLTTNKNNNI